MADQIHKVLVQILKHYGPEVYEDRRRLVALLRDLLARQARSWQVKLLILSIEDGVLERLIRQMGAMPQALLIENHARQFSESFQIYPDAARWVIESWLVAFVPYAAQLKKQRRVRPVAPTAAAGPTLPPEPPKPPKVPKIERPVALDDQESLLSNALGMQFVRLDPGEFIMGSPLHEAERDNAEVLHRVSLSRSFYLQTTPVTQAQWESVMQQNPSAFRHPQHPVEKVSWLDGEQFIQRLNQSENFRYRFPSEAEWEYAARAGSQKAYSFGDDPQALFEYAWIDGNSRGQTQPVQQKQANAWGLYDMYGNVRELCQDWFAPYVSEEQQDPRGPDRGSYKVCRGGSWKFTAAHCRSASRHLTRAAVASSDIGLRLVLEL